jgi:hypothetical protein
MEIRGNYEDTTPFLTQFAAYRQPQPLPSGLHASTTSRITPPIELTAVLGLPAPPFLPLPKTVHP